MFRILSVALVLSILQFAAMVDQNVNSGMHISTTAVHKNQK